MKVVPPSPPSAQTIGSGCTLSPAVSHASSYFEHPDEVQLPILIDSSPDHAFLAKPNDFQKFSLT
eukprot:7855401-Karenia_brevis.AAC.1